MRIFSLSIQEQYKTITLQEIFHMMDSNEFQQKVLLRATLMGQIILILCQCIVSLYISRRRNAIKTTPVTSFNFRDIIVFIFLVLSLLMLSFWCLLFCCDANRGFEPPKCNVSTTFSLTPFERRSSILAGVCWHLPPLHCSRRFQFLAV